MGWIPCSRGREYPNFLLGRALQFHALECGQEREHHVDDTSEIPIRYTRPEDVPAVLEIYNSLRPYRSPMTPEEYDEHLRSLTGKRYESWVAEIDGRITGDFDLFESPWTSRPDTFVLVGEVAPEFRGRGIGSRLYDFMARRAAEIGTRRMYTEVPDTMPESIAFLERRGWTPTGRADRPSRLTVSEANLDGFSGVEQRLQQEGIRITTLQEVGTGDTELLRAIHAMESRTAHDIPSSEPPTQEPFEKWLERQLHGVGKSAATFWIALDGKRPVGVARLRVMSGTAAGNNLTGVDPDYRGRGIARALKFKTVEWARENGIESIYTENDIENRRILAINVSLGYRPLPAEVEMVKDLPE